MASKRAHSSDEQQDTDQGPSSKRAFVAAPPVNLGPIATEEELDLKVLQFQNAKLYSRLEELKSQEDEFNTKIYELERLHSDDQTIISILNRTWNQLDEDVCILLQRFKNIEEDEDEYQDLGESTVAFLERLSDRTKKSMEEETEIRRSRSKTIITRLVALVDKTVSRNDQIAKLLSGDIKVEDVKPVIKEEVKLELKTEEGTETEAAKEENFDKPMKQDKFDISMIETCLKDELIALKEENKRLHSLNTSLHDKHNSMSTEFSELHDKHATAQKDLSDLTTKSQDMEYDLQKAHHQVHKLIHRLNEIQEQGGVAVAAVAAQGKGIALATGSGQSAAPQDDDAKVELEEQKELANNRLTELQKLQEQHKESLKECEQLRFESQNLSEDAVMQSPTYKALQVKFTMLYNDAQFIRSQAEDARKLITSSRAHHIMQMDQLDTDAATTCKKVRQECNQLEKTLTETRRELELLRIEYEHNMKAHEQIGPMAKEMRHLINSLQNHNQQLKGEVMRYKRKLGEAETLKSNDNKDPEAEVAVAETEADKDSTEAGSKEKTPEIESADTPATSEEDIIKNLRLELKQSKESEKELKLLLDMYKLSSKETREKTELLKIEKSQKDDIESLNIKINELKEELEKRKQEVTSDEAISQLKTAQETIEKLEKSLANTKQEEDALVAEMEFTGQAFEEMQEQNIRLMQQLREKDDANLKLMSERIKANQLQKLLREEKEALVEQLSAFSVRHHALEEVVKRHEEREKVLQSALQSVEKEASLRQQASEMHKRKAVEAGQQVQELTFRLESIQNQVDKVKDTMIDRNNRLEEESFKCRRMQEENSSLKRKLDKAKKMEYLGASDEILVEEVKMYKAKLTCPCCNTRRKDAILTKCFHVFCFECLKTRYDTRQRKCPKCNATFGNNDFHKIYM